MKKEHINYLTILYIFKGLSINVNFILYQYKMQFMKKSVWKLMKVPLIFSCNCCLLLEILLNFIYIFNIFFIFLFLIYLFFTAFEY